MNITLPRAVIEQEPVAKVCHDLPGHIGWNPRLNHLPDEGTPLYTAPLQRKPLTEEEIKTYRHMIDWTASWSYINFARAIEAAHGIREEV